MKKNHVDDSTKRFSYSIRKTSLGVGSVLVGLFLLQNVSAPLVQADEIESTTSTLDVQPTVEAGVVEEQPAIDKEEEDKIEVLSPAVHPEDRAIATAEDGSKYAYDTYRINHALYGTATANDTEVTYYGADKVNDGIVNPDAPKNQQSRWSTNRSDSGTDEKILTVSLSEKEVVDEFVINWERTNIKGFRIETSEDGNTYETVYTKPDTSNVSLETVIKLAEEKQKAIKAARLVVTNYDGGSANWKSVSVYEFRLHGPAGLVNIAYGKTATANASEAASLGPDKAIDDNMDSRWASSIGQDKKTFQVDLKEVKPISTVVLEWERKNAKEYSISVSKDGNTWTEVKRLTAKPKEFTDILSLDGEHEARYVKLDVHQFDATGEKRDGKSVTWATVSLYEFKVFAEALVHKSEVSLREIAEGLVVPSLPTDGNKWSLPTVPEGVTIEFIGANLEQIIDRDLTIYQPIVDTDVTVNYRLKRGKEIFETQAYTVHVKGKYTVSETDNARLNVLPGIAEWKGHTGKFQISDSSRIVVASKDKEALSYAITSFKEDYEKLTGRTIAVVYDEKAKEGDFYFELNQKDPGLKKEGYLMTIGDSLTVEANQSVGAFWATQTLLQLLNQDKTGIDKGIARDYPKFEKRGFVLDVGRKPIGLPMLKDVIKALSWYKFNDFHIHLNDNYINVEDYQGTDNPYGAYSAFRLESNIKAGGNGGLNKQDLTAKDLFYTKQEFKELIEYAKMRGIQIVPEFDTPAHSLAFTKVRPDLTMKDKKVRRWVDHLEVSNPASLEFVKSVWDEYLDGEDSVFGSTDVIHVGVDEFEGNNEAFRSFTDSLLKYAISKGKTPRFWGSLTAKNGHTPVIVDGVEMNIWSTGWANPKAMYDKGYKLINTLDGPLYIVPAAGYYNDFLNAEGLYNNWEANNMGGTVIPAGSDQMLGAAFAIWNDKIDKGANGILEHDVFKRFEAILPALSSKMWGNRYTGSYDKMKEAAASIGKPADYNPYNKITSVTSTVLDYRFDLGTASDLSGNNYDGTNAVNVDYEAGKHGRALRLKGGESYIETPISKVGPDNHVSAWVKLDQDAEGEQILLEAGSIAVKLVQKDTGKVGYSIEGYDHSFDYTLPKGEWVHLTFKGYEGKTELYVNGALTDTLTRTTKVRQENGRRVTEQHGKLVTFTIPSHYIGSKTKAMKGLVDELVIGQAQSLTVGAMDTSKWTITTDNENHDGKAVYAFDNDLSTIWHTQWTPSRKNPPAWIEVDMKEAITIDRVTYIPRQVGTNGDITSYKLYSKLDNGEYKLIKEGRLTADKSNKVLEFPAHDARYLKIEVLEGAANFGSAAEFVVGKVDYKDTLGRKLLEALAHVRLRAYYQEETMAQLEAATLAAGKVWEEETATVAAIQSAVKQLEQAIAGLAVKQENEPLAVNKIALNKILEEQVTVQAGVSFRYASDSAKTAYQLALQKAKELLADQSASQEQVDKARTDLEKAVLGLDGTLDSVGVGAPMITLPEAEVAEAVGSSVVAQDLPILTFSEDKVVEAVGSSVLAQDLPTHELDEATMERNDIVASNQQDIVSSKPAMPQVQSLALTPSVSDARVAQPYVASSGNKVEKKLAVKEKPVLPATGQEESSAIALTVLGLVLSAAVIVRKKKVGFGD